MPYLPNRIIAQSNPGRKREPQRQRQRQRQRPTISKKRHRVKRHSLNFGPDCAVKSKRSPPKKKKTKKTQPTQPSLWGYHRRNSPSGHGNVRPHVYIMCTSVTRIADLGRFPAHSRQLGRCATTSPASLQRLVTSSTSSTPITTITTTTISAQSLSPSLLLI